MLQECSLLYEKNKGAEAWRKLHFPGLKADLLYDTVCIIFVQYF